MEFNQSGLNIDSIVNLVAYKDDFTAFLLDVQSSYRIERAMWDDPNNKLLTKAEGIDDLIVLMEKLEPARSEYFAKLKEEKESIK